MNNKLPRFTVLVFSAVLIFSASAEGQMWVHPFDFPQSPQCPIEVMAAIEIPAGSFIKYELDKVTGHPVVDRFQSVPMIYPANYGVISQTLAGDGDSLDVLVYTRVPIQTGALILVRPIGVLKMIDGGEQDDKIIAVPAVTVDPTYAGINTIEDLPLIERERLEFFFRTYKSLPPGRKIVDLRGLHPAAVARELIVSATREYAKAKKLSPIFCRSIGPAIRAVHLP